MISIQKYFLESVNKNLKEIVQIAAIDFAAVNELLKSYYVQFKSEYSSMAQGKSDVEVKLEAMMGGLQYMDVFNQRVTHLINTHETMVSSAMATNFEESFFHLHVFQSLTIELDLLRAISSIKDILIEVKETFEDDSSRESVERYFVQTEVIKNILQSTIKALSLAGGERRFLPIPVLTNDQVQLLNTLYTMESERVVLTWFLNSMPTGSWEDLLQYYENAINQVEEQNTELF